MPLFCRYLLKHYVKVFLLSVISFITLLLVSRLEDVAEFAAVGAKFSTIFFFTAYQVPYILPFAIPISCLLSAMVLFQRLSHSRELTALRAGGISLFQILYPIGMAGLFLSLLTFYITSELATTSHLATRKMVYDLTSKNPLMLLQSTKLSRFKGAYIQMDPIRNGEAAKDLVVALYHKANKRLFLCLAKELEMEDKLLKGKNIRLISTAPAETYDHLVIENQEGMEATAADFSSLLTKKGLKIANDHLKMKLLGARRQMLKSELKSGLKPNQNKIKKNYAKCRAELVRRVALGLSAFSFTLLGATLGIDSRRTPSKKGIIVAVLLTALTLICFFIGKELDHLLGLASLFFLLPQGLILIVSWQAIQKVNRGVA